MIGETGEGRWWQCTPECASLPCHHDGPRLRRRIMKHLDAVLFRIEADRLGLNLMRVAAAIIVL
jgi:hypothetical protein